VRLNILKVLVFVVPIMRKHLPSSSVAHVHGVLVELPLLGLFFSGGCGGPVYAGWRFGDGDVKGSTNALECSQVFILKSDAGRLVLVGGGKRRVMSRPEDTLNRTFYTSIGNAFAGCMATVR
jgi:hypothetical protein